MLFSAILFGFAIFTQTSCKIILPPIPKLYGTSNCETTLNPGLATQSQTIVTQISNPADDCIKVYNCEKPSFPTISQAPCSVLGVQTRTLIAPYPGYQYPNSNQNAVQTTFISVDNQPAIPQTMYNQVVSNPTCIGIAEPSPAQCYCITPIADTIIAPTNPIATEICDVQENILINSEDSITGISEAFQQLLDELIESKLNGYTALSSSVVSPDVQVNVIEPEVNIDLVPNSAITAQVETNKCNSFSSISTNCSPMSEGSTIARILIPSEIPAQLICDISEIQALQPSLTYEYQPISFSFC